MKLALCFYGQPRSVDDQTHGSIKDKLVNGNDVDVYAHFWYSEDPSVLCETSFSGSVAFHGSAVSAFTEAYSPKNVITETPMTRDALTREYTHVYPDSVFYTISRFTSVQKVLNSIQDPSQYQLIALVRSDLILSTIPDINTLDTTKIHVTARGGCNETEFQPDFVLLPPSMISTFTAIPTNIDTWHDQGVPIDNTSVITKVVNDNRDNVSVLKYEEFSYAIKRSDGNVQPTRDQF